MLRLDDHWIWDSWIADDGDRYHLFFLQAPRSLGDPGKRHVNASVGHATSRDLVCWDYLGECLGPSKAGFDDLAIWTGSVVRDGGLWWMFYTGISTAGHVVDQRIGAAVSDDLHHWRRVADGSVVEVNPLWYKTLHHTGASETWRDPLVLADPGRDGWHMLMTARAVDAGRNDDGVVAHASSRDLRTWRVEAPLSRPGTGFGQLEVIQSRVIDGRPVLVFTCHPDEQAQDRIAAYGEYSTWSVPAPGPLGPWDVAAARPFTAEPELFAAPLVQRRDGSWAFIGFHHRGPEGDDGLAISDPIPVVLDGEGYIAAR